MLPHIPIFVMATDQPVLLCADLDRTLLPNGSVEESAGARKLLRLMARRPGFHLVYVTGRRQELIREAIAQYELPEPSLAVADVGATIYTIHGGVWSQSPEWAAELAACWQGRSTSDVAGLLANIKDLEMQSPEAQSRFKLSYFVSLESDQVLLLGEVRRRLESQGIEANLIWSVDEAAETGLLDILPVKANKRHGVEFARRELAIPVDRTVFAGDSGNDLEALTSGIPAVLVRNGHEEVRREAVAVMEETGLRERLYLAKGDFLGMNGNYAAGALEGMAHFIPEVEEWLREAAEARS